MKFNTEFSVDCNIPLGGLFSFPYLAVCCVLCFGVLGAGGDVAFITCF